MLTNARPSFILGVRFPRLQMQVHQSGGNDPLPRGEIQVLGREAVPLSLQGGGVSGVLHRIHLRPRRHLHVSPLFIKVIICVVGKRI